MKYELKSYSFWKSISEGINMYLDNFVLLYIASLIFTALYHNIPVISDLTDPESSFFVLLYIVDIMIYLVSSVLLSGLAIIAASGKYLNKNYSLMQILKRFFAVIIPLLAYAILISFIFGIYLMFIEYSNEILLTILVPILTALLVVAFLAVSFTPYSLIINKISIKKAVSKSIYLTDGYKGQILGTWCLFMIASFAFYYSVEAVVENIIFNSNLSHIIVHGISASIDPVFPCVMVIIFFNKKVNKESFNVEHLAKLLGNINRKTRNF